jgi:hypothetical protein
MMLHVAHQKIIKNQYLLSNDYLEKNSEKMMGRKKSSKEALQKPQVQLMKIKEITENALEHIFKIQLLLDSNSKNNFISDDFLQRALIMYLIDLGELLTFFRETVGASSVIAAIQQPIDLGSMKDQVGGSIQVDNHWYTDDEIIALLNSYIGNHPEVAHLDPMLGTDWGGGHNTLRDNLRAYHIERSRSQERNEPTKNKVLVPVNLGNGHWVLVYAIYPENSNELSQIYYFDSQGNALPDNLRAVLLDEGVFHGCEITNIGQRVQNDDYNCGPWAVEASRGIADRGAIPDRGYDINNARIEHASILNAAPLPQSSQAQKSTGSLPILYARNRNKLVHDYPHQKTREEKNKLFNEIYQFVIITLDTLLLGLTEINQKVRNHEQCQKTINIPDKKTHDDIIAETKYALGGANEEITLLFASLKSKKVLEDSDIAPAIEDFFQKERWHKESCRNYLLNIYQLLTDAKDLLRLQHNSMQHNLHKTFRTQLSTETLIFFDAINQERKYIAHRKTHNAGLENFSKKLFYLKEIQKNYINPILENLSLSQGLSSRTSDPASRNLIEKDKKQTSSKGKEMSKTASTDSLRESPLIDESKASATDGELLMEKESANPHTEPDTRKRQAPPMDEKTSETKYRKITSSDEEKHTSLLGSSKGFLAAAAASIESKEKEKHESEAEKTKLMRNQ